MSQEKSVTPEPDPVADLVARAKRAFSAPLYVQLRDTGLDHDSFNHWASGRRRPPPDVLRKIAEHLREHVSDVVKVASELDRMAARMEQGEVPRRRTRSDQKKLSEDDA